MDFTLSDCRPHSHKLRGVPELTLGHCGQSTRAKQTLRIWQPPIWISCPLAPLTRRSPPSPPLAALKRDKVKKSGVLQRRGSKTTPRGTGTTFP